MLSAFPEQKILKAGAFDENRKERRQRKEGVYSQGMASLVASVERKLFGFRLFTLKRRRCSQGWRPRGRKAGERQGLVPPACSLHTYAYFYRGVIHM